MAGEAETAAVAAAAARATAAVRWRAPGGHAAPRRGDLLQHVLGFGAGAGRGAGIVAAAGDDVLDLAMWLDVSGVRRQNGSTSTMIFDPYFIVHYLSQFLVLEPGDLINTGTPPGVGMGLKPPVWLQPGDVMELGIEGLGSQRQAVLGPR